MGFWLNGKMNGLGQFTSIKPDKFPVVILGEWLDGK